MRRAFTEHDALSRGHCAPGQIMSAVTLIEDVRVVTLDK